MHPFYQSHTLLNFLPSTGICFMMSSELKMGSRYSHDSWHLSHASKISCMLNSLSSHSFISSSNGLMYAELWITIHNSNWCKDNKIYIHQNISNKSFFFRFSFWNLRTNLCIVWAFRIWSSNICCTSSTAANIDTPDSRYGTHSKQKLFHSDFILS